MRATTLQRVVRQHVNVNAHIGRDCVLLLLANAPPAAGVMCGVCHEKPAVVEYGECHLHDDRAHAARCRHALSRFTAPVHSVAAGGAHSGRQAEHRGRVHAVPLLREPHARVRTAGVLVDARMRKLLSIAKRELDVFAQLFPDAMPEAVPTWAQLQALARA